ncbi:beta-ketoacyl synthase N-terminal-like domain-containing protein [Legionella sp.]|uniref:type I polyketide synthase n=1 Tax=Legionella sp. TaxID=459 RepID=UPI0032209685
MNSSENDIAVIGYSCRVPGASSAEAFWSMLCKAEDALVETTIKADNQISTVMAFSGATEFDANFFNYSRFEAELLDPQQRIFLETCWHALEMAGYAPDSTPGLFGIYAGCAFPTYLLDNIHSYSDKLSHAQKFQLMLANDKDYLATRVAYKLNLSGQAVGVQTACSTSLVALHLACQALLNGELDGALAGGVSLIFPQNEPYTYQEGMILSEDGHCRPFAADASGTVIGDGVGVVVLKRYEDAIRDRDSIYALIKGTAINNDGHRKVSFIAPNVASQAAVISEALAVAQIEPESISYIEAHGTGTKLGDPIEIAALKQVFAQNKIASCALGSVKANIGHLNTASGIIGTIKTIMALHKAQIPPQINCESLNPACEIENSFLYINKTVKSWDSVEVRRAGVSSFGFGGTNAHAILQQATEADSAIPTWTKPFGLKLSAKSLKSLKDIKTAYHLALSDLDDRQLANFCFTANAGRSDFPYRLFFYAKDRASLIAQLSQPLDLPDPIKESSELEFYFPHKSPYGDKIAHQWEQEALYKKLRQHYLQLLGAFPNEMQVDFVNQFALAQYLKRIGIYPSIVSGHGLGLLVAACLGGYLDLEQAIGFLTLESSELQLKQGQLKIKGYDDLEQLQKALLNFARWEQTSVCGEEVLLTMIREQPSELRTPQVWGDGKQFSFNGQDNLLMSLIGFCYTEGVTINWANYYKDVPLFRIAIPGYAFDRQDYNLAKAKQQPDYLYEIQWQPSQLNPKLSLTTDGQLFIVLVRQSELDLWTESLADLNCIFLVDAQDFANNDWTLLNRIYAENQDKAIFIIHALSINSGEIADKEQDIIAQQKMSYAVLLHLGQFLSKNNLQGKLWLLSDALSDFKPINPLHGELSGLAAVMATEIPRHWGGCIHSETASSSDLLKIVALISQAKEPLHVSLDRQGIRQQKLLAIKEERLVQYKPQPGDIYVIAGGSGAVGQLVLQQLVDAGAEHFIVIGRHKPDFELVHFKGKLDYIQCDLADFASLSLALRPWAQNRAVKGMIHAAGLVDDALLLNQSLEKYSALARAKVQGSWNLHLLSLQLGWQLDFFLMFSSLSALFGPLGQANYAAANAFQNHLSVYRQRQRLKSTSILLGSLDNLGMAKSEALKNQGLFERINIQKISPTFFRKALENIYQLDPAQVILQPMDLDNIKTELLTPLQQQLILTKPVAAEKANSNEFRAHLAQQSPATQLDLIIEFLQQRIANKINCPVEQLPLNTGFNELGLDSLMAVDIKEEVDKELAINLPVTTFFNASTVVKLSQVIVDLCQTQKDLRRPERSEGVLGIQEMSHYSGHDGDVRALSEDDLAALIAAEFEQL